MKIGVLGLGSAGKRHFQNVLALGHSVESYDPAYNDLFKRHVVLHGADAVIITSPSECHIQDLKDCVERGLPVLVEKPIALAGHSKDVSVLLEKAGNLPIAVGFNLRFHPAIMKLQEVMHQRPYYGSFWCCQYTESKGPITNGCVNEWAPHEIDLARYVMDDDLRVIDKHVDLLQVDLSLLGWGSGCHVHLHSDMRYRGNMRGGHVLTEDNEYRWDFSQLPVTNNDYLEELKAFIEYVETGQAPLALATGQDGLAALQICERADNVRLGK